jgi:hypothetical protein
MPKEYRYIGHGIYSLSDAERLTRIPKARIRRWLEGYSYDYQHSRRRSEPIVRADLSREMGELALTFADLMEVRFLDAFRDKGVSWREIRAAAERVGEFIESTHPFSNRRFRTDGRAILAEIERDGDLQLLRIVKDQWEIHRIVAPFLLAGVDFDGRDEPRLWRPVRGLRVVIDPLRSFGSPIAQDGSVPTRVLAAAARAERSARRAARVFRVPLRAVEDSVKFERRYVA